MSHHPNPSHEEVNPLWEVNVRNRPVLWQFIFFVWVFVCLTPVRCCHTLFKIPTAPSLSVRRDFDVSSKVSKPRRLRDEDEALYAASVLGLRTMKGCGLGGYCWSMLRFSPLTTLSSEKSRAQQTCIRFVLLGKTICSGTLSSVTPNSNQNRPIAEKYGGFFHNH